MEVMYALPRVAGANASVERSVPCREFIEEFYRVRQNSGDSQSVQVPVGRLRPGEIRTVNVAIAPLVTKKVQCGWAA